MKRALLVAIALTLGACAAASDDAPETLELADSTTTSPTDPPKLGPPYPIVLAHGFFGFEDFAGAGFLTYYYDVKEHLAQQGETQVFTPAVDPFNHSRSTTPRTACQNSLWGTRFPTPKATAPFFPGTPGPARS